MDPWPTDPPPGTGADGTELQAAIERLRASEAHYRAVVESTASGLVVYAADGAVVECNAAAERMLGRPREQILGRTWIDPPRRVLWADGTPVAREQHPAKVVLATGEPQSGVVLGVQAPAGETTWLRIDYTPLVRPEAPGERAVVASFTDISAIIAAERELAASESRYRVLTESMRDVVWVMDAETLHTLYVSPSVRALRGFTPEEIVGAPADDALSADAAAILRDEVADRVRRVRGGTLGPDTFFTDDLEQPCRDGSTVWTEVITSYHLNTEADRVEIWGVTRDITQRRAALRALDASRRQYQLLAENASDVVWQMDDAGRIVWASESVARVLGLTADQVVGHGMAMVHPDDLARAHALYSQAVAEGSAQGEFRVRTAAQGYRWMSIASRPLPAEGGTSRIVTMRDIHEQVLAEQDLRHALGRDALTGLATRSLVTARLARLLELSAASGRPIGVLCAAVDSLRDTVDALGHAAGDRLMTIMTTRLATAVGDPDLIGRGSGNELFVLLPDLVTRADAAVSAARIREEVRGPLALGAHRVEPTLSVGITVAAAGDDPERLLHDAGLALRQAKARGRDGQYLSDPTLAREAQDRLAIEAGIRAGLRLGEFTAAYQPIVDLGTATVTGYEALVRWIRPDGTTTPPDAFLPVAEATGLVHGVDMLMLEQAAATLAQLPPPMTVAVNAAAGTLARGDYAQRALESLRRHRVDPTRLHIEVTETTLVIVTRDLRDMVDRLAEAGARWYVDDFGTGYSSISHLRDLPISGLKLDRSYTAGILTHTTSRQLAAALAALASTLELDCVAEGVETHEQAGVLRQQGWAHAQGWLFGRPAPQPGGVQRTV